MQFVDTHCHLFFESFYSDLQDVIEKANNTNITRMIVPGLDIETSEAAVDLAISNTSIFAAVGFHPSEVRKIAPSDSSKLLPMLVNRKVIAIGEIGLDFYHDPESKLEQINLFTSMLQIAAEVNKPVVIHSRNAIAEVLEVIERFNQKSCLKGVIHAFEGNVENAQKAIDLGFKLGIGGAITYKNAEHKQKLVQELGIENIVLETDSPFLPPHPFRGERNEPARITVIADKISQLTGLSIDEISSVTTMNAEKIFQLGFTN